MTAETGESSPEARVDAAELIDSRPIFKGKVVDLRVDRVRLANGHLSELEVISHPGAAAVVPVNAAGEVMLVRQFRHAAGRSLLEVPAGKLSPGEDPASCAARELEEETGYRAGRLEELGWIWTTPGFTDERIWLYLARELEAGRQNLDPDESLEVVAVPWREALERVERGEIRDSKSACSLLLAERYLARGGADRSGSAKPGQGLPAA